MCWILWKLKQSSTQSTCELGNIPQSTLERKPKGIKYHQNEPDPMNVELNKGSPVSSKQQQYSCHHPGLPPTIQLQNPTFFLCWLETGIPWNTSIHIIGPFEFLLLMHVDQNNNTKLACPLQPILIWYSPPPTESSHWSWGNCDSSRWQLKAVRLSSTRPRIYMLFLAASSSPPLKHLDGWESVSPCSRCSNCSCYFLINRRSDKSWGHSQYDLPGSNWLQMTDPMDYGGCLLEDVQGWWTF